MRSGWYDLVRGMAGNEWEIDAVVAWKIFVEFWRMDWGESVNPSFAGAILYCSGKWGKWRESRREDETTL